MPSKNTEQDFWKKQGKAMMIEYNELDQMGGKVCNPVRERRFGKFTINMGMIEKDDDMLGMYNGLIVLDARACMTSFGIEYQAAHKDFDPVPEGCLIPEYLLKIKKSRREVGTGNRIETTEFIFEKV